MVIKLLFSPHFRELVDKTMAFSKNIKGLVLRLHQDGHSAEDIVAIFSKIMEKDPQESSSSFREMSNNLSLTFTEADWQE